jgi:hypothetical protein
VTEPTCSTPDCGRPSPDAFLCRTCTTHLERTLAHIPSQLRDLEVTITKQARANRGDHGKATKQASQPLPIDLTAQHLADQARNGLSTWIRHLTEARGLTPPRITLAADMATWLVAHIDSIRQDELAGELHTAMDALARELRSAVDNHGKRYAGPCIATVVVGDIIATTTDDGETVISVATSTRQCGADLRVRDGATTMTCKVCGREYTTAERLTWILSQSADHLATATELARVLTRAGHPVTPERIRKWAERTRTWPKREATARARIKREIEKGTPERERTKLVSPERHPILAYQDDIDGNPTYRLGDVLARIKDRVHRRPERLAS